MRIFLNGAFTAALLGALWMMVLAITFAVAAAFASGAARFARISCCRSSGG